MALQDRVKIWHTSANPFLLKFCLNWPTPLSPVDLSVRDIRSQIAAAWLEIVQWSQCRACRKPHHYFEWYDRWLPTTPPSPEIQRGSQCTLSGPTSRRMLPLGVYDRRYRQDFSSQPHRVTSPICQITSILVVIIIIKAGLSLNVERCRQTWHRSPSTRPVTVCWSEQCESSERGIGRLREACFHTWCVLFDRERSQPAILVIVWRQRWANVGEDRRRRFGPSHHSASALVNPVGFRRLHETRRDVSDSWAQ